MSKFRVWPHNVVQAIEEEPYSWLSDDFFVIDAEDEEAAEIIGRHINSGKPFCPHIIYSGIEAC